VLVIEVTEKSFSIDASAESIDQLHKLRVQEAGLHVGLLDVSPSKEAW
jgi:hypothetical protein